MADDSAGYGGGGRSVDCDFIEGEIGSVQPPKHSLNGLQRPWLYIY